MYGAALGAIVFLALVVLIVVLGASPVVFVPLLLVAVLVILIPFWRALLHRTTFRQDTGAPSTTDSSYDPVQRP